MAATTMATPRNPLLFLKRNPILLVGSSKSTVDPRIFASLYTKSKNDAALASFLETAFEALQSEHQHILESGIVSGVVHDAAPPTLRGFAVGEQRAEDDFLYLALVTVAEIGLLMASGKDIRKRILAGSRSVEACIFDRSSSLATQVVAQSRTQSELLSNSFEVIRLACYIGARYAQNLCDHSGDWLVVRISIRDENYTEDVKRQLEAELETHLSVQREMGCWVYEGPEATLRPLRDQISVQHNIAIPMEALHHHALIPDMARQVEAALVKDISERHIRIDPVFKGHKGATSSRHFKLDLACMLSESGNGFSEDWEARALGRLVDEARNRPEGCNHLVIVLLGGDAGAAHKHILEWLGKEQVSSDTIALAHLVESKRGGRYGDEPVQLSAVEGLACKQIAVVGMACRVPGAEDVDEFWQLLEQGRDMCSKIPERLYRVEDYHAPSYRERNVMRVSTGNTLERPGVFDRSLFGYTIEDCFKMDPQQRLSLLAGYEALEMAGYGIANSKTTLRPDEWSTHIGYCSDDYRDNLSYDIQPGLVDGTQRAHLSARLNRHFGFTGAAITYDTACSSALVAIEAACNALIQGQTSAAITGGVNVVLQPQITIGLDRGFFLASSGQCLCLEDSGAGYSRADAISLLILKRLPDAVKDGDPILGVISSAATNHSGESFSITHPHAATQRRLYRSGMLASNKVPDDVGFIEMHGTGTQSGDFEEVTGIVETFAKERKASAPLIIGSVKSNLGHSESTSGATSMLKALQAFQHSIVPRHIGIRTKLNTKLPPLDNLHIPLEATPFIGNGHRRVILVDNFSAAGGNSSIMLEEPPLLDESADIGALESVQLKRQRFMHISAATPFSLDALRRRLIAFLDKHPDASLQEFCYVASARRSTLPYRLAATPSSIEEAKVALRSKESVYVPERAPGSKAKVLGFAFSGQGAQYLDMGRELYESSPSFRASIDRCSWIGRSLGFPELLDVLRPKKDSGKERSAASLSPVQYQLALTAIQVGLVTLLGSWGIIPSCVAGHSLGEYAALWTSSVLSLRDLISLVGGRAMLMIELCEPNASSMLAIRDTPEAVERLIQDSGLSEVEIACLNSPTDTVVAGKTWKIEALRAKCDNANPKIKAMAIPVPYAFHSRAVEPLMERYSEMIKNHRLARPTLPVAANATGSLALPGSTVFDAEYLVRHLRQPVRFSETIIDLERHVQVDHWIELGPHSTTIPMLKGCYAKLGRQPTYTPSLRKGSSAWEAVLGMISNLAAEGVALDLEKVYRDLGMAWQHHRLTASLPRYPFDLEDYMVEFRDRGLRDHLVKPKQKAKSIADKKAAGLQSKEPKKAYPKPRHALLTACVEIKPQELMATFEALVNRPPFSDMIKGHLILGVPLTPATVFVELALEAGRYLCDLQGSREEDCNLEVRNLSMFSSLYLDEADPDQCLKIGLLGELDSQEGAYCHFFSGTAEQNNQHQYGTCKIFAAKASDIQSEWKRISKLTKAAADQVQTNASSSFGAELAYKNFEAIVLYLNGFRGMQRIWISEDEEEAVSLVKHNPQASMGSFLCSPMLMDSLGGLTGFISNVNFASGPFVYMAEAIGRIVLSPELASVKPGDDTEIRVYARMEKSEDLSTGGAYFFRPDGSWMGMMEGIVFKKIRRDVLQRLVTMSSQAFAAERQRKTAVPKEVLPIRNPTSGDTSRDKTSSRATFQQQSSMIGTQLPSAPTSPTSHGFSDLSFSSDPAKSPCEARHLFGPKLSSLKDGNAVMLFPDGTGLASVYPAISESEAQVPVYGFDSPYFGKLKAWTRGMPELVDRFVDMLKGAQPVGPYRLGGWSIGGIAALEVARKLLSAGEKVELLVLMDVPFADLIRPMPSHLLESILARSHCASVREHFRACAMSLPHHRVPPFTRGHPLPDKVIILNATDQSRLPGLMASQAEWISFFQTENIAFEEIEGDHWTCLGGALQRLAQLASSA